ncbi:NUDIX hydrolase [Synechocystis sp. PCC 7509]|uniref:NUDIX hydrolase n=1 Tax=Synechocystis sp. PCC 7509 TaxID=927677 RepID=UPI0002ACD672|nr:NUDIX hydrolase [Synechocystis sp. PCC 7509]
MSNSIVQVAIAILYQNDKFLMQLRDDIPNIVYPGHWGLFGGHLEPGETPDIAVKRELLEEISYTPPNLIEFGCYPDEKAIRYIYYAPLTVELNQLVLLEGWDMDFLTIDNIEQGIYYSQKAQGIYPLVSTAQKILLDFIDKISNA